MGKKIGIITMHKVLNYGSVLQAYALQHIIEKLGHNAQIIDYTYPNAYHKQFNPKPSVLRRIISSILKILRGFPLKRRAKIFAKFYNDNLNLSRTYNSKEELDNNPPQYDMYLTGSDQVWNPQSIHEDTSYMLSFTDNPNKAAFAASFAKGEIPEQYRQLYASELKKYKRIFVREEKGAQLVEELIGKKPEVVVDPTLLLTNDDWRKFAEQSTIAISKPYILVYVLGYSFNVYPYIYDLIKSVQKQLGLQLVVVNMSKRYAQKLPNKRTVYNASVYDFVKLFSEASMVITDSFHGTAFSLNLNIPFYSVVNDVENADSRIVDLLTSVNESSRIIRKGTPIADITINTDAPNNRAIDAKREHSINLLSEIL